MHTQKYHRLRSATGKHADAHYDCITKWLTNRKDAAFLKDCLQSARKYKRSVETELNYLRSRPKTDDIDRRISEAEETLKLIERDIKALTTNWAG